MWSILVILFWLHWTGSALEVGSSGVGGGSSRSMENFLSRLNSRLDTIVLRIDHLDNRIGRIQTLLSTRLDGIENSVATMKLRLDLVKEEVTRVDENLNRKWKNFETKVETSLIAADNKYDSKLNMVLREGRRIGESLHGIFSGVEKRVTVLLAQVNTSLIEFTELNNASLKAGGQSGSNSGNPRGSPQSSSGVPLSFSSITTTSTPQPPASNLIINKVSNMFDDLIERSSRMENLLKESVMLANVTRTEVHDSIQSLSVANRMRPITGSHHHSGIRGPSVAEETSMAILETLASTESMSTTISRRLNELTRTIEERFELVSMTLNEFYESCSRIQEGAPLIEEHIAELLDKILNSFENRTSVVNYKGLENKLDALQLRCLIGSELLGRSSSTTPSSLSSSSESSNSNGRLSTTSSTSSSSSPPPPTSDSNSIVRSSYEQLIQTSEELSEEDKKLLWDSLFPHFNGSSVPE